jgi:uncharacterized protein (DUF305 family)
MIKTKLLGAGAALAAALLLGACGSSGDGTGPTSSPSASGAPGTLSSAAPAKGAHNDADVAFASMMIPHHDQAIEMSDILLAKSGIDPKVTALAHQIKIAQGPEVAQMGGWLAGWGSKPGPSMGGMGGMGDGMMSQADMDGLKDADGHQAARLFLTGMIKHHQGAVIMAQSELASGQNPDAKKLAHSIVTAQRAEITEMNQLLGR